VRILLLSIALLAVASCMSPQVPGSGAEVAPPPAMAERGAPGGPAMLPTYPPVALVPSAPPPVAAAAPPPPPATMAAPVAAPAPPPTQVASLPPLLGPWTPEPSSGRLTLSNFSFDSAHVVATVTTSPDCAVPAEGDVQSDFRVPLNGTRIITARPGADVCWRRQLEPDETPNAKGDGWTGWNRAFLSSAITVTSQL
jgi:hypothetical protein